MPEFFDIDVTKNLLSTIDEYGYFQSLFSHIPQTAENMYILVGEEFRR